MKAYKVTISNEASDYTSTKYNNTLTGFTSEEAASKAAKEALRDAAGEINKGVKVFYSETLNAWVLANNGNWLLVAKVEEVAETEPTTNTPATMKANDNEYLDRLRYELQEYHNNASKGGANRQRNMAMLAEDIARLEASANKPRTKSINGIMNQANHLMSVCNAVQNFKRADAIRAIAFRYYDNIRACVRRFNYNDDGEYNKEYSRAQYMNA